MVFFSIVRASAKANKTEIKNLEYLKVSVFVNMSAKEFAAATGNNLIIFQKIYFKVIQRQIKRDLKKDSDLLINNYFDQNRTYVGVNYEINKKISLQLQYMHIWQLLSNGITLDNIDVIRFNIYHTISL